MIFHVVLCFTKKYKSDKVDSFVAELWSRVNKWARGENFTYPRNRYDYEVNIKSQGQLVNVRFFVELLAVQLTLIRNLESDDRFSNDYIGELRTELQKSGYINTN